MCNGQNRGWNRRTYCNMFAANPTTVTSPMGSVPLRSLMRRADTHLGITLSFINDASRAEWEPQASTVQSRLAILRQAHELGIYTWVSMEPVIIPQEALEVIKAAHSYVDFWKVGKLNHNKRVERSVDWPRFRNDVTALLDSLSANYYIKEDLRKAS